MDNNIIAQTLKAAFNPYFDAPLEAWQGFAEMGQVITTKRHEVLKKEHEAESFMYFILEGSAGVFLWKEHNFVCLDIAVEHQFFCDMMSMLQNRETPLQTMTLEPCKLLRITKEHYVELGKTDIGHIITKAAAEGSFIHKQQQQIDLLTKSAEQRFDDFLHDFPSMMNRISQKHIASYVGMTPQSFSRLKKKLTT